jgi:hypothetical protein
MHYWGCNAKRSIFNGKCDGFHPCQREAFLSSRKRFSGFTTHSRFSISRESIALASRFVRETFPLTDRLFFFQRFETFPKCSADVVAQMIGFKTTYRACSENAQPERLRWLILTVTAAVAARGSLGLTCRRN